MPTKLPPTESLAYHAARLLILVRYCGKPQSGQAKRPSIKGRTLLAKLDFFMRYPLYLKLAAEKLHTPYTLSELGLTRTEDIYTVESHMVRYLYGPWDSLYYVIIAYLIGKELIEPVVAGKIDSFTITNEGMNLITDLESDLAFTDYVSRAKKIYSLFNGYNGSRLKEFIYESFPEVVNRELGKPI